MTAKLDINLDDFEKWLTPEIVENVFFNAGYEVELKDEFKYRKVELKIKTADINLPGECLWKEPNFTVISQILTNPSLEINSTKKSIDKAA